MPESDTYTKFLQVRADYLARERAASEGAEKVLIAGSAAALALSVTFIEKIATKPSAYSMRYLAIAWILLLASLSGSILTYVLRSRAYRKAREVADAAYREGDRSLATVDLGPVDRLNAVLAVLVHLRLWPLLFGVMALVYFAFMNIPTNPN